MTERALYIQVPPDLLEPHFRRFYGLPTIHSEFGEHYDIGPELIEWVVDFTRNMVRLSSSGANPRRI